MKEIRAFGECRFNPATGELWRVGTLVRLPNQPARMLAMLSERPGELITREELRHVLWAGDTHVDFDGCLNYCARKIRVALGDTAEAPIYLETVPRRGYRFISRVEVERHDTVVTPDTFLKRGVARLGMMPAVLSLGLVTGFLANHVIERVPWHDRVVQALHRHVGTLPVLCYWPWG